MNSRLFLLLLIGAMMGVTHADAQKGYWVVESNVNARNYTIVRMYDLNNQLIRETALHRKVEITRGRDRRMLDRMLKISFKDHEALMTRKSGRTVNGA